MNRLPAEIVFGIPLAGSMRWRRNFRGKLDLPRLMSPLVAVTWLASWPGYQIKIVAFPQDQTYEVLYDEYST